ncbi:GntR family transcriptional regulator [Enterococcus sp.]|jgi:GntR family transcriptional regulator|uniref:GntR family transcriptional regulator n=1 Tax=Enterococcus sp. TaxID=35783 RepID=UPI0025C21CC8|nr:GntR family transcriptional regulator [Enterococcus sp.]
MSNGIPYYLQIAEEMRNNVQIGKWKEGEKIPTEFQLCEIFHVSRITIRKAIDELVKENLLQRERSKGTFVRKNEIQKDNRFTLIKSLTDQIEEFGDSFVTKKVNVLITHADQKLATYLDTKVGEKIIVLKRLMGYDKKNIGYFLTYFKFNESFSLDPFDYYGSFYTYLKKEQGITVINDKEVIEAIMPMQEVAYHLRIKSGTPVLKRSRFASDATHTFKEYTECYYTGNEYKYYIAFR